jgi:outer membrane murein-binding lipoprotein Lpp
MSTGPGYGASDPYGTHAGAPDPDARPATAGELRGLRRWLVVTAIWAVAASAIGLIALFGGLSSDQKGGADAGQVADLARKVAELQSKVSRATSDASDAAQTASQLSSGIDEANSTASDAKSAAADASSTVSDLQQKVDELEQRVELLEESSGPAVGGGDTGGEGER